MTLRSSVRSRVHFWRVAGGGLIAVTALSAPRLQAQSPRPPVAADAAKAFLANVQSYMKLRAAAAASVPELRKTRSPDEIARREAQLAEAVMKARPGAKEGDLFGPAHTMFVEEVRRDWQHRPASERTG